MCPAEYTIILTETTTVKDGIYHMDFPPACDQLTECPTNDDIARQAACSVQTVRQARMDSEAAGYRPPPGGWEKAIAKLSRERAGELVKLAEELEK